MLKFGTRVSKTVHCSSVYPNSKTLPTFLDNIKSDKRFEDFITLKSELNSGVPLGDCSSPTLFSPSTTMPKRTPRSCVIYDDDATQMIENRWESSEEMANINIGTV